MSRFFTVAQLIEDFDYVTLYEGESVEEVRIYTSEINRPGLQLAGFYGNFVPDRIQIIGGAEWEYLHSLEEELRKEKLKGLFERKIPLLIITRGQSAFQEMFDFAKDYNCSILSTEETTARTINRLINYMDFALAPTMRRHGILLDVFGVGVLIVGKSGVGKSETAIELIQNGHKLIADDSVIIKKLEDRLVGTSPDLTKYYMEIRGVGIINVERLFGIGSVMEEKEVELIVELKKWEEGEDYDRLGIEDEYQTILGKEIPFLSLPMSTGRDIAIILEIAVRNFKQKMNGYNAAEELNAEIIRSIAERKNRNILR